MPELLTIAANDLSNRECPELVIATGLLFRQLSELASSRLLKEVIVSSKGGIWGEETLFGVGYPVLRSTNMRGTRVDTSTPAWIDISADKAKNFILKTGDILVTKSSGSTDLVGKAALFLHPGDSKEYLFSNFTLRLQPNRNLVLPEYIAWFLRSPQSLLWRYKAQQNSVGLRNLQTTEFLGQAIPIPDLEVQKVIVTCLNALEAKDSSVGETLPAYLKMEWQIVMRIEELVEKVEGARGLRSETVARVEAIVNSETTRIFENLGNAPHVLLGQLGIDGTNPIQTGPFGSQLLRSEFVASGVPVLNVGNVQPQGLNLTNLDHVLPEKANTLTRYSLKAKDLLFARTGATLGKVCLLPEGCDGWLMTGHLFRVRLDEIRCNPKFAFVAFRGAESIRAQVFDQVRGATRPGFNTTLLSRIRLPLPSLAEQEKLVTYLDGLQAKVDSLKRLQTQTDAELDALLPSIFDKAFKGEL